MALNGNSDEVNGYNSVIKNGDTANVNLIKSVIPPIGTILAWAKTFGSADSGTTDGTTTNKLVDAGQNFVSTINIGMIVHNTTDDTFANVTAIDDNENLSLDADIMISGEDYIIYKTPQLPDGWVECDGNVLSDSDSPYNGETIPDLNGSIGDGNKGRFLRGHLASGQTEISQNLSHTHTFGTGPDSGAGADYLTERATSTPGEITSNARGDTEARPFNYSVVFIMRIK